MNKLRYTQPNSIVFGNNLINTFLILFFLLSNRLIAENTESECFNEFYLFDYFWKQPLPERLPTTTFVIKHKGYTVAYDGRNRNPFWGYERLTPTNFKSGEDRDNLNFKIDHGFPKLIHASLGDYKNSGFDKGHMAAAANHDANPEELEDTFCLSNACPQNPHLNRGFWLHLENYVRHLTIVCGSVEVITGPLYVPRKENNGKRYMKYEVIGPNDVAVPTHFFKIVFMSPKNGEKEVKAFIVPNVAIDSKIPLERFETSLQQVEHLSGFVF